MVSSNRRIAILLRDLSGGGAERSMINIANGLASKGVDVDLVLFRAEGEFKRYVAESVNIVSLDTTTVGVKTFRAVLPLARYFRKCAPDHILTTLEATTIVASCALRLVSNCPKMLIRVATTFGNERRAFVRGALIGAIYRKHAGCFVVNSKGSKEDLNRSLDIPNAQISVVYNAIDLKMIASMSHEPPLYENWLERNSKFVLNIGRLTVAKRQDCLIRAFSKIPYETGLSLLILGEGPLREELESLVRQLGLQDKVFMPGFVNNPYVYLARASVFVLSSQYEGMPTVLLEALTCGCPVVSTDCPAGPDEILEGGKWGELTPVDDPVALAGAISRTIERPLPSEELRRRGAAFSVEKMADEYHKIMFGY